MSGNQVHDKNYVICGAKTRKGTLCLRPAGWGTAHPGEGKCKLHGGASTGPKNQQNNKNAVTTGEHESIVLDVLEEDEKELLNKITLDKLEQIDNEIKLTEIRERRMLLRIKEISKNKQILITAKLGMDRGRETDLKEVESSLVQIQSIEEALTRVQAHKVKLINTKHVLEQDLGLTAEEQKLRVEKLKVDIDKAKDPNENKAIAIRLVTKGDDDGDSS